MSDGTRRTPEDLRSHRWYGAQDLRSFGRGFGALYLRHITQADQGCDFDFLEPGPPTPEPEIH